MRTVSAVVLVCFAACSGGPDGEDGEDIGPPVSDVIDVGCSTEVVIGLSLQIAGEMECLAPGMLVEFAQGDGIVFTGGAVLPLVTAEGLDDLQAAIAATGGELRINSAFRTVVQQLVIRRWFDTGQCGISAAATPGNSNHESARALDIENFDFWADRLPAFGWEQTVLPSDPVHFDHLASPDSRGLDVLSFQRLWNRNRPDDPIDEDGEFGAMTEARIEMSPSGGFASGPDC